ncbi:killer cell lectin-like receptor subfamily G member 1 isoform X1 [Aquarana catesbeiana]|uniref:killer cell lectin-like receptor subfamily G member 1 isoform X1 n=1 Tax=Aquarana catesbeiana TaxID=8400 RepID=UPI003CC95892
MERTDKSGKKLWRSSWKGVIVTLLVGSNIILIRIIEALVYKGQSLENEISQLGMNLTQSSTAYQHDREKKMMDLREKICGNNSECTVCPGGWLGHNENCYYISSGGEYRTWNESREVCEGMGAHLLVIEDRGQQEFINRSVGGQAEKAVAQFWIGLYRDGDGWRWVDGRLYNISLFQISTKSSGNCVRMHETSGYHKGDCQSKQNWICQKRALKI